MCLFSLRKEFENLRDNHPESKDTFYAYKVILKDLRSWTHKHQRWIPDIIVKESHPQTHPKSRDQAKINRSIHAYRGFNSAKRSAASFDKVVIIKVEIFYSDVTGANENQCTAKSVYWDGTYYDTVTKRWKKLKLEPNW